MREEPDPYLRDPNGTLHPLETGLDGYLVANVVDAVDPPARDDSVRRSAWTTGEVHAFLTAAAGDRLAPVWRLALASGLRRGELCGLQWGDVDGARILVRRQVLVRPMRTFDEDRVYVRETTKSRRARTVTVDEQTAAALRRWRAEHAEELLAFGHALSGEDWVVAEADGSRVHPDTLSARWKRLEQVAGVRPIGLHGARHTHATLALAAGAPPGRGLTPAWPRVDRDNGRRVRAPRRGGRSAGRGDRRAGARGEIVGKREPPRLTVGFRGFLYPCRSVRVGGGI